MDDERIVHGFVWFAVWLGTREVNGALHNAGRTPPNLAENIRQPGGHALSSSGRQMTPIFYSTLKRAAHVC